MIDSTTRFSDRVEDYVKYRPQYPGEIIEYFKEKIGLVPDWNVADIGSGTGILSKLFLSNGNTVYGVEPNKEMREAGEKELHGYKNFFSVEGTAERTNLNGASFELITAGQAFHWFNLHESKKEFIRIMRPEGFVALIWNSRKKESTGFSIDYEKLLNDFGTDYKKVDHKNIDEKTLQLFFSEYETKLFPNYQELNLEGLKGRLMSSSYIPARNHPLFNKVMKRAEEIFTNWESSGKVKILYDTEVFIGKIK